MIDGSWLVMSQGPQPGQTFMLDRDWITVGRDPSNDIVINDPQVSRQHARITRQGQMVIIEDVGSTNGSFANGMRLTGPHVLSNGDVLGLGDSVTLTYYEVGVAADVAETLVGHPGGSTAQIDTSQEPPDAPAPAAVAPAPPSTPTPTPQPFAQQPPPTYGVAPPPPPAGESAAEEGKKGRVSWLLIGCVGLALLAILSCVVVVALDAFQMLPDFFYEPIRWLGLESYFTG
jgi:predicted component of type VI protein secretion system